MTRRVVVSLSVALVLGASCFSESPSGGGDDEGTSGEPCTLRTLGCPCDDGACDAGLSCEPSIALCIDPSCTPGTELCTCIDGNGCIGSLACDGGLCRTPPPSGEDSVGATMTTPGTTSPADDGETLPGEADVTSLTDTIDPVTTSLTVGGDDDPTVEPGCGALPCAQCYECAIDSETDCLGPYDICSGTMDSCPSLAACTFACPPDTAGCVEECCFTMGNGMGDLQYQSLVLCLERACGDCSPDLSCPI